MSSLVFWACTVSSSTCSSCNSSTSKVESNIIQSEIVSGIFPAAVKRTPCQRYVWKWINASFVFDNIGNLLCGEDRKRNSIAKISCWNNYIYFTFPFHCKGNHIYKYFYCSLFAGGIFKFKYVIWETNDFIIKLWYL